VSALTGNDWNVDRSVAAGEMTHAAQFESSSKPQKFMAIRDTLIVFAMQIVFRTTMFLRRLNY
jgi:hypothetical protein